MDPGTLLLPLLQTVTELQVDSADLPTYVITAPFGPGDTGGGGLLAREKFQLTFRFGPDTAPLVVAPWGTPPPTRWPTYATLLKTALVGAIGYGLYRATR